MRLIFLLAISGVLHGCASILSGTTQDITINSEPDGANCMVERENVILTKITTPETIEIKKTKHDLTIKCTLDGYYPETVSVDSEIQGSTWGNIILSGGVGWAVDSARGADNRYDDTIIVRLTSLGEGGTVVDRTINDAQETESSVVNPESEPEIAIEDTQPVSGGGDDPDCCR